MSTHNEQFISLETAKEIIVSALSDFDSELGQRAAGILYSDQGPGPKRLNVIERPGDAPGMMQCRPAGLKTEDLQKAGMYFEPDEFNRRFGPDFVRQDNPEQFAMVDYKYVGTKKSLVFLAHEIGHAIADDLQIENGVDRYALTMDDMEVQAYYVQRIVEQAIDFTPDKNGMGVDWYKQYETAGRLLCRSSELPPVQRRNTLLEALTGHHEPVPPPVMSVIANPTAETPVHPEL